ncbi:hypothetical protein BK816_05430 [Boudabousia tangfeifanii]|uniref:LssY-like C-terminal domain-containing protein n=1 Tax=Boudabousia tangfeifanii TaxID=1912795 RepID=A0A1D9MKI2_9ACTO|nr:LssY C-terminal domain-containing protein [Boudabousia tangfeifanii]AOZ72805.1 hypothetical protein BK816_05430 [Boudabousia tangfeifanii]
MADNRQEAEKFTPILSAGFYPVPDSYPKYLSDGLEIKQTKRRIYLLVDSIFVILTVGLTLWFAGLLLWSGMEFAWKSIVVLLLFWAVLAYLLLPRIHQVFTTLYVPDYFMARTKTGDGLLGDPVNLALLGEEEDIHAIMAKAGWVRADEITLRSSWGIVKSSLTGKSYPNAPVSDLFLFGHRHAFAYQQEVDGSAAQRHHVRFWPTPQGWDLPGKQPVDWLAAGTYDKSVGLSTLTFQVTHKIDDDVDAERDYIIKTIRYTDPECKVKVLESFSTAFHDRNGGGDIVRTDGNMPILDLSGAAMRHDKANADEHEAKKAKDADKNHYRPAKLSTKQIMNETLDKTLPPPALGFVGFLTITAAVLTTVVLVLFGAVWLGGDGATLLAEDGIELLILAIAGYAQLVLYILTLKKYAWARIGLLSVAVVAAVSDLWAVTTGNDFHLTHLLPAAISLLVVLALTAPAVREWVSPRERRSGDLIGSVSQ